MKKSILGALIGSALTVLVLVSPTIVTQVFDAQNANAASISIYRQLDLFGDVFEQVRSKYVEKTEDADLMEAAIEGMLTSLDPHSSYLNPDEYSDMEVSTSGEFGGLGIEVTMEDELIRVVSPIDDTPASRAGIQPGDLISHINSEPIRGLTMDEAIDRMRGPEGTELTITVLRNELTPFDVVIKRAIITIETVRWRTIDNIGYIRISTFSKKADSGIHKAISSLKKDLGKNLDGIVLDLRSNPGGLLDQAVAVTDAFLDRGEIVSTRGRQPKDSQRYNARSGDLTDGAPVIVLIDGGSASASEIVAGALKDHRRATVVGTQSFGKGSVQTVIPLNNGNDGALRLTTAKYYTPSGISIHEVGVTPDVIVELEIPEPPEPTEDGETPAPVEIEDIQLDKAVEMLKAMAMADQKSASIAN